MVLPLSLYTLNLLRRFDLMKTKRSFIQNTKADYYLYELYDTKLGQVVDDAVSESKVPSNVKLV